jgi:Na+(H+)/acetate symporter ActP
VVTLEATLSNVREEQKRVDVAKAVLSLLLVLPFVLGWTARMLVRVVVWALSFAAAAVQVGWRAAAPAPKGG